MDTRAARHEARQLMEASLRGDATSEQAAAWASAKLVDDNFEVDDQTFWNAIHTMIMLTAPRGYESTREDVEVDLRDLVADLD